MYGGDKKAMNEIVTVATDCASICLFDPIVVNGHEDLDDWCEGFGEVKGVCEGLFFGVDLGSDGIYKVRITNGELQQDEMDYATAVIKGLGLSVVSGSFVIGGYGFQAGIEDCDDFYQKFDLLPGRYSVDCYRIDWFYAKKWHREDGKAPGGAPVDCVICLREFDSIAPEVRCNEFRLEKLWIPGVPGFGTSPFLFESSSRELHEKYAKVATE